MKKKSKEKEGLSRKAKIIIWVAILVVIDVFCGVLFRISILYLLSLCFLRFWDMPPIAAGIVFGAFVLLLLLGGLWERRRKRGYWLFGHSFWLFFRRRKEDDEGDDADT